MYYLKGRYYDPTTQRFTQEDTYKGNNPYAYCNGNPVNGIDPNGHFGLGDRVVVWGRGYGDSYGGSGRTYDVKGETMTINRMVNSPKSGQNYPYHVANGNGDVGWFGVSQLTSVGGTRTIEPAKPEPPKPTVQSKTIEQLAKEVINGSWGNGADRKDRLTAAGYDYYAVQALVNQLVASGSSSGTGTGSTGGTGTGAKLPTREEVEKYLAPKTTPMKGYLNHQTDYTRIEDAFLKDMKFGILGNLAANGCGIIAIYNVLIAAGKYKTLTQIAIDVDVRYKGTLAYGALGANPVAIQNYLISSAGFRVESKTLFPLEWNQYSSCDAVIVLTQNPDGLSMHYMAGIASGGGNFRFYNGYNRYKETKDYNGKPYAYYGALQRQNITPITIFGIWF